MNPYSTYNEFFRKATGHRPFDYQRKTATSEGELPHLYRVPTGCGKTAAITLAWLWRRRHADSKGKTPRRLIYCLPMRVLVEQTVKNIKTWLENLEIYDTPDGVRVSVLMGGEDSGEWDLYPEKDTIIVGTQDMLLSRALNRGYSMSRFRWPVHFGLSNNDCLWVMDEVQLMGPGLTTSLQLDAFREMFGVFGNSQTVWMSATCEREWLKTVDREPPAKGETYSLDEDDIEKELRQRVLAEKSVDRAAISIRGAAKEDIEDYIEQLSEHILKEHSSTSGAEGDLTLVVMNTVDRAQRLYERLKKKIPTNDATDIRLLHSRFRPAERSFLTDMLNQKPGEPNFPLKGRIFIATQVVEAGVDISSRLLFTELAPWTSTVQRLGRLNREGEYRNAKAYWTDMNLSESKSEKIALPYSVQELEASRTQLENMTDGSPMSLSEIVSPAPPYSHNVPRNKDITELFDTTPDLSGNDIDISVFIRNEGGEDVRVFWRTWEEKHPSDEMTPGSEELCPVTLNSLREFAEKRKVWGWNHLDGSWNIVRSNQILPGRDYLIHASQGGYSEEVGWSPRFRNSVNVLDVAPAAIADSTSMDHEASVGNWQTLEEHTDAVVNEISKLIGETVGLEEFQSDLKMAARFHDLGKAHLVFQEAIGSVAERQGMHLSNEFWAKSGGKGLARYKRKYFRHELASALATIQHFRSNGMEVDLAAYLVAAHHGKVRCSIRSLPDEDIPNVGEETRFARGIWENDEIPTVNLGGGHITEAIKIDMSPMEIGYGPESGRSWYDMVSGLRDRTDLGPYRLAFLEGLLRVADWKASIGSVGGGNYD